MDPDQREPVIRHIDLWNRNVEFIDQEIPWERPAVFVEFSPVRWNAIVPGVEYRAEPQVVLHIVTDWAEVASDDAQRSIDMLDLPDHIHDAIAGLDGRSFRELSLVESQTNHNHEEIVENIEVYGYVAFKSAVR
ncbi:MAG: hypothetical protein HDS08_07135 [Bacteroides sp.]|nr:hypothetical protein [Bacteroidales bacterium]MBD5315910.1 hypothetical protein [Bacteroides sp.]